VSHLLTIIEVEKVYVSHLLTRMKVEEVYAIYSQGWRWRRWKPFTHKDEDVPGVSHLLISMEVKIV
jgi:hypothetical protein